MVVMPSLYRERTTVVCRSIDVMRVFPLIIFLHAVIFASGELICKQDAQSGTLAFQKQPFPTPNSTLYISLLRGISVILDCCLSGITNATVIIWETNGTILSDTNSVTTQWTLTEQQQVLTVSEPGLYVCTATDGQVSISKSANITTQVWDPTCRKGTVGGLRTGFPPTDVYDVSVYTNHSLTCEAILYCGSLRNVRFVQWWKIREGTDDVAYYLDGRSDPAYSMDVTTGDWVNATAWYEDEVNRVLVIQAVLNIQNVTIRELYDENESATNCSDNSSSACSSNDDKYYYQCVFLNEDSDDPSSNLYTTMINTRLHSYSATNVAAAAPPPPTAYGDSSDWKREGTIFGCLLGAFVVVVALVALLYVRYEWHIRVYFKRLSILIRSNGKTTHVFAYDCYVACAREDEPLVYGVLSEQLEKNLGYKLCLPERDFTVGAAVPEQIGSFIEKSEFFLAIISPRFWNTDWCKLAMDMALRTNTKVIAVFILDNPKAKADRRPNVAQALKAPGCSEFVFRTWKTAPGHDSLVLKLQCAMPRPRSRSGSQRTPAAQAVQRIELAPEDQVVPSTHGNSQRPRTSVTQPPSYTSIYGRNPDSS